jgi:4-amino-4-deoxy-L-arabinose transferase-like glycosyltransferase
MHIVLLLLNIALVVICTIFILSFFNIKHKSGYLLGAYIVSYASIVLILELAGLFSAITPVNVLLLQILSTTFSIVIWHLNGKPVLLKPFSSLAIKNLKNTKFISIVYKNPLLSLLVGSIAYVYTFYAQKILIVPPDNWDSLTYRLSRIGYWLQYQSFLPWPTRDVRQTTFPMNAELGILWSILWWGTDQLSGFVQWITVPVIAVGIYGLVRLLGYSRSQGAFTALLWTTLAQVLYQSSTTQNDLVVTSFWVAMVYFLFAGLQEEAQTYLYLSGIAFGLAMGTKSTSLIILPALALVLILIALFYRKRIFFFSFFTKLAIACLLGFFLFGSYIYLQNIIVFGHPLGPNAISKFIIGTRRTEGVIMIFFNYLRDNTGRYIYQLFDFSPLPFDLASKINPIKKSAFSYLFNLLGLLVENPTTIGYSTFNFDYINPFNENRSWFGPLMTFLIPTILYQAYQGIRRRNILRISLVLFAVSFFVIQSAMQVWTPAKGRYFMIVVALAFPLLASLLNDCTVLHRLTRFFLVLLGLTVMLTIVSYESGFRKISWGQVLSGQRNIPAWDDSFNYRMITENVPINSPMGVAFGKAGDGDYPLFGEHFTRRITRVIPDEAIFLPRTDIQGFKEDFEQSEFLFMSRYNSPRMNEFISNEFSLLSKNGYQSLWIRKYLRTKNDCDESKWPFTKFYSTTSNTVNTVCPQFPISIGVAETRTPDGDFVPVIGTDTDKYLEFGLLAKKKAEVTFKINMFSGKIKAKQILQFTIAGTDSRRQVFYIPFNTFNKNDIINLSMPLEPDTYRIHMTIADGSAESKILKIHVVTH